MTDELSSYTQSIQELEIAQAFYQSQGLAVDYFPALWRSLNVGHMMTTDLDRICRHHDLSLSDFNLLGALGIDQSNHKRPTDLAVTLHVSNASLSARTERLASKGLLEKIADPNDGRGSLLKISPVGIDLVLTIHRDIERQSHFVHYFRQLCPDDRAALERALASLNAGLSKVFKHVHR